MAWDQMLALASTGTGHGLATGFRSTALGVIGGMGGARSGETLGRARVRRASLMQMATGAAFERRAMTGLIWLAPQWSVTQVDGS